MKKTTKAAIFVTAAAALYGAAAYGVTRTLMDVAMKREAPKALKNKGSAQLTGEKRDESYREAQRAAAKKLASLETETVLLENREGLTLVGHLRECEKAKRLVIAFHGWRSAWYRDFGLLADFLSREQCSVLYVEQRAQNESEGDYIGFGLTERYDCVDWANWAAERFPGLPVYLMGVSLGRGDGAHGRRRYSPRRGARRDRRLAYTSPRAIWQHVMGKNLHLPVRAATVIADSLCKKRLNASSGSYSTVEALKNTDVPVLLIHGEDDHFVPLKMAFENRDACAAPCKLLVVPGADHAMSYYMGRGAYEAAVRAFWEHFGQVRVPPSLVRFFRFKACKAPGRAVDQHGAEDQHRRHAKADGIDPHDGLERHAHREDELDPRDADTAHAEHRQKRGRRAKCRSRADTRRVFRRSDRKHTLAGSSQGEYSRWQ